MKCRCGGAGGAKTCLADARARALRLWRYEVLPWAGAGARRGACQALALSRAPPDRCLIWRSTCGVESTRRVFLAWEVHGRGWLTRAPPSLCVTSFEEQLCHVVVCCKRVAPAHAFSMRKEEATVASQVRQSWCAILREHSSEIARKDVMHRVVSERIWCWILTRKVCGAYGVSCLLLCRKT